MPDFTCTGTGTVRTLHFSSPPGQFIIELLIFLRDKYLPKSFLDINLPNIEGKRIQIVFIIIIIMAECLCVIYYYSIYIYIPTRPEVSSGFFQIFPQKNLPKMNFYEKFSNFPQFPLSKKGRIFSKFSLVKIFQFS